MDGGEGENSRERGKRERWFLATRLCRRQRQDQGQGQTIEGGAIVKNRVSALCVE